MTTDTRTEPTTPPASLTSADARRAARNAGALAVAGAISKGALFAWQLVLAPLLGPHDFGVYGTVGALFAIGIPLAGFGMGPIVIRDVARYPERAGRYWTAMLFSQTLLALLAYISINLGAGILDYEPVIQAFVALAGVSLLIDVFGNMGNELLLAQERMLHTSLVEIGHITVRLGLAGAALLAGYGLPGVYAATIIAGIGRWWVLWALLLRAGVRPHWPLDRTAAWPLLANSAPLALTAFMTLAYQHIDKLMTTHFVGATGTGYLTAAFIIIFGVVEMLGTTALVATFPMMSRYSGSPVLGFMVEKLAFFTALVTLPLALVLSIFSPEIMALFGTAFAPAAGVLAILIWYTPLTMVANVFARGLMVQNRQRRIMLIRGGGLLVNLALNSFLLPRLGVQGAAVSTVCAETLALIALVGSLREDGLERRRLVFRLARLAGGGALVGAVMLLLRDVHVLAGMLGGLAVYAAVVLLGRVLADDDWDLLYRLAAAMPGGALVRRWWKRNVVVNW